MVHRLEIDYWGQVEFLYLDIDDSAVAQYKQQFNFRYQPHLILLDGEGNVVQEYVGAQPEEDLRAALDNLLAVSGGQ